MSDVRTRLDSAPMSRAQVIGVALITLLSALDGYDVLSMTFAAPAITAEWGVGKGALGVLLSAGLVGMALGSFFLAPLADIRGRRTIVVASLGLMAAGALLCASAGSVQVLAMWRVLTGIGIGACMATISPLAAEFANSKRRPLTVSLMAVGYPAGGVAGGLLAAWLLHRLGWSSVFLAGFAAALIMLPLVLCLLPESPAYLIARGGPDSLRRLNLVLARFGHDPVDASTVTGPARRRGYAAIFAAGERSKTVWLVTVNSLYVLPLYFMLSWMPQMVADAGFSPSTASLASVAANSIGVLSGLLLGWVAQRGRLRGLSTFAIVGFGVATIAFGFSPPLLMIPFAGLCGFFLFAGISGIYTTLATSYADAARASGVGFVIGVGRVVSAAAPFLAGWLFASGLGRGEISLAFGASAILSGLALSAGWSRFRGGSKREKAIM